MRFNSGFKGLKQRKILYSYI